MKSFLVLFFLLTLASTEASSPVTEGKRLLEIQIPRKLGLAEGHTHKLPMRMAIAHRAGRAGSAGSTGGGGAGVGGRNVNGGAAETRPHTGKNGAAALPVPATASILALAFTCATILSAFSF